MTGPAVQRQARRTAGHAERVAHSVALLRQAAVRHPDRVVQVSSLGVEGMVLTDLAARHGLAIPVATLDTGMLHAQTLALLLRIRQRWGIEVEVLQPQAEAIVQFVQRHGERAMFESVALRQACCDLRKVQPMQRLLAGRTAWITGLRREQSSHRGGVDEVTIDDGREKFCPLAAWSEADVWQYVADHDVPYNPLHDDFMPSIGCAPCTRAVLPGEDPRAGRWWWEQQGPRECGLHLAPARATATRAAGVANEVVNGIANGIANGVGVEVDVANELETEAEATP